MKKVKGATLIVVLVLLMLITMIGTWAIRQSLTSLSVATHSQAQQLLMQSSDTVFYHLGLGGYVAKSANPLSLLGYVIQNEGDEVVFCFRGQSSSTSFNVSNTSLLEWNDAMSDIAINGVSGFCSLSAEADYASARKAQMTQVSIIASPPSSEEDDIPLNHVNLGTDNESLGQGAKNKRITVYATSLIPILASTSQTQEIQQCLKRPSAQPLIGSATTISDCLRNLGVPFNTQVQSYIFDAVQRAN